MARKRLHYLTDEDIRIVKEFINEARNTPKNSRVFLDDPPPPQAPEVYIAKLPTGGINARSVSGSDITIHGEDCDIYKVNLADSKLIAATGIKRKVWNPYPVAWYGNSEHSIFLRVERDKFGNWLTERPQYRFRAVANEDIEADDSGDTVIHIASGVAAAGVTAFNDWMNNGVKISSGKQGIIEFFEDLDHFSWVEAECE
jgi:hypothetical protein